MPSVDPGKSLNGPRHEQAAPSSFGQAIAPPPPVPPILSSAPTIVGLLRALRRRWLLALTLATLGAAATALVVLLVMPAPYTASTRIVFDRRPPGYMVAEQSGEMSNLYRSQMPVFRSKEVLDSDEMKKLPFVPTDPAERYAYLDKTVTIEVPSNQEVLRIAAAGENPEEMAQLVNALVKAYRDSLKKKYAKHRGDLDVAYNRAIVQLDDRRQALTLRNTTRIVELERQLQQTQLERKKIEAELKVLESHKTTVDKAPVPDVYVEDALRNDSEYVNLQTQWLRVEKQIRGIADKSSLGETDPKLERPVQDRAALRAKMEDRRRELKPKVQEQYAAALRADYEDDVARLSGTLESLKKLEGVLNQDFKDAGGSTDLDPQQRKLADADQRKLAEIQVLENTIKRIDGERKTLDAEYGPPDTLGQVQRPGEPERLKLDWLRVLGDATAPTERTRDKQLKVGGVATGGVFLLLLALVAFVEFRAQRLNSTDEVVQGLGLPLVGTIPALPARVRNSPATANTKDIYWQSQLTEAVDALRTFLIHQAKDQPCVVMITSGVAGEGKTSLASQLAASLARAWRKTLLVDGDLRKPAAHKLFDLPQEPGLSEVLRSEMEAPDVVRPTPLSRLWVMPAGQWDPHALQALAQEGVGNLFRQLKEEYDFVIVDSCPVLPVADTLLLGQHVDTVLFSALRGHTRLPTLYAAQQRLLAIDIPILGVVVIGARGTLGGLDIQYPRPNS